MSNNFRLNQRGLVSLVTVTLASILFTIVVIAMVGVVANEERQASEADLSNRAYFAAEGGVEKGLLDVKNALQGGGPGALGRLSTAENDGKCQSDATVGYTCLSMGHTPTALTGDLKADGDDYQVDLSGVNGPIRAIEISWHTSANGPVGTLLPSATLSPGTAWNSPAAIEVQSILFNTAQAANFNPNDPTHLNILENTFVPTTVGGTYTETSPASSKFPVAAKCTTTVGAGGYACDIKMNTTINPSIKRILRLRARYAGTSFRIKLYNASGAVITNVPDTYETLDVTAKSGNTFRRARAKVAIYQSTAALDYALFSDGDICHDFGLRDSRNGTAAASVGSCPF